MVSTPGDADEPIDNMQIVGSELKPKIGRRDLSKLDGFQQRSRMDSDASGQSSFKSISENAGINSSLDASSSHRRISISLSISSTEEGVTSSAGRLSDQGMVDQILFCLSLSFCVFMQH
jgi:hypothetical protein